MHAAVQEEGRLASVERRSRVVCKFGKRRVAVPVVLAAAGPGTGAQRVAYYSRWPAPSNRAASP